MVYQGVIIEESLANKSILGKIKVIATKVEPVVEKHKTPWLKQWTLYSVEIPDEQASDVASQISQALTEEKSWYADFKNQTHHYIIFKNKIFYIDRASQGQYDEAKKYGTALGIPEYQVDFHPNIKQWDR